MNIEKEINSILEKFIIHLYDDFDFKEAKLKIANELKDYYYTEEELYDKYWFGKKYVRDKIFVNYSNINNSSNEILEKICKEELGDNFYDVFALIFDQIPLYYRKYYGRRDAKKLIKQFIQESTIGYTIMTYLSFYYCENYEPVEIIIDSVIDHNILK